MKGVTFIIRHAANGNLRYIDPESVPYLGYLPQDLADKDALQLYHHEDLMYLRQLYETIVKEGSVPLSKPYRYLIFYFFHKTAQPYSGWKGRKSQWWCLKDGNALAALVLLMSVGPEWPYFFSDSSIRFKKKQGWGLVEIQWLTMLILETYLSAVNLVTFFFRLLAQNGDFVKVETEWSCFINPWSRKLEFVTAKHHVLEVIQVLNRFFLQIEIHSAHQTIYIFVCLYRL